MTESTTHKRNQSFTLDRIEVERILLEEVKRRNLLEKYYSAWEYIYLRRYALNTFYILASNWDMIPYKQLVEVSEDLEKEFPSWYKNPYYIEEFGKLRRGFYYWMIKMPHIALFVFKHVYCIKKKVFKYIGNLLVE